MFENEPALAESVAEYAGMPVAAIAADTYDEAFAAAKVIEVVYEELEAVLSIEEAWEKKQFTYERRIVLRNAEAVADTVNVVSGEVSCGGQDHFISKLKLR